jgi:single-strand DNA-binding protein
MNNITIVGNTGKDAEMRYTATGTPVTKFSVADNLPPKDKGGESKPQWFNVTVFGAYAETLNTLIKKGELVAVSGRLEARTYTKVDNSTGVSLDIIASEVKILTPRDPASDNTSSTASDSGSTTPPSDDTFPF